MHNISALREQQCGPGPLEIRRQVVGEAAVVLCLHGMTPEHALWGKIRLLIATPCCSSPALARHTESRQAHSLPGTSYRDQGRLHLLFV